MSPVALVILAFLSFNGTYAPHILNHPLGPAARAEDLADKYTRAADAAGVERTKLLALGGHESAFREHARSRVGAQGQMQLFSAKYVRPWRQWCRRTPSECEYANIAIGAKALRESLDRCGSYARAYGHYRTGRCVAGPRSRATMQLARQFKQRIGNPDAPPVRFARMSI